MTTSPPVVAVERADVDVACARAVVTVDRREVDGGDAVVVDDAGSCGEIIADVQPALSGLPGSAIIVGP